MPFDCLQRIVDLVIQGIGPVVMNGDADIIFFNQLIKAFKTIGLGVGTDIRDTGQLGELEDLFISFMVFAEAIHSMGAHAHVMLGQLGIHFANLLLIRRNRVMPPEKLHHIDTR